MWKIILGILVAIVILVVGGAWYLWTKMQKMVSNDGPVSITVAAPAERVFTMMSDADSVTLWMQGGRTLGPSHHGMLVPGDTLRIPRATSAQNTGQMYWVVTGVTVNQSIVMDLRAEQQAGAVSTVERTWTITPRGDSTDIVGTAKASLGVKQKAGDPAVSNSVTEFGGKMMRAALHMEGEMELKKLKEVLEGNAKAP